MNVTNVIFEWPPAGGDPTWKLQIDVNGDGFLHRAAPVVAMVGDVLVEALLVNLEGDGFVGMLRELPQTGDVLKVGYLDSGVFDTTFTYEPPPPVVV